MTIKIFKIGECDWVAAETGELAKKLLGTMTDVDEDDEARELSEYEMKNLSFVEDESCPHDDDSPEAADWEPTKRSFEEELAARIARGEDFPQHFAASEW